jgi:steroid 5-alpha reductase family enzyme
MENSKSNKTGVNRGHGRSVSQKLTFATGHFAIILMCAWLIYGNGWEALGHVFGKAWQLSDFFRAQILIACAFIYWLRHVITLFYLLARKVEWSEVAGLLVFMGLFEIGLVLIGGGAFRDHSINLGLLDLVALVLFFLGSFLNSFSEIQRKWWKADTANKGLCYTKGLFRYSMHINYFGDTVLFTGWCLFTYNFWTLGLPFLMGCTFVFFHIPDLDSYLADRYGDAFITYSENTKKFIPFIY